MALLFAATLTACSLVMGWNDLGGGCRGDACDDGGHEPSASLDASEPPDAATSTGDGATSTCRGSHDLCDDFDGDPFPNLVWTTLDTRGGATGEPTTGDSWSKPRSFRARAGGDEETTATLIKSISGPAKTVSCEFEVNPDPGASTGNILWFFSLSAPPSAGSPNSEYLFYLGSAEGSPTIQELWRPVGSTFNGTGYSALSKPRAGAWQKMRVELVVGSTSSVKLSINGGLLGTQPLAKFPTEHDGIVLAFGALSDPGKAGGTVLFDDIVCDVGH